MILIKESLACHKEDVTSNLTFTDQYLPVSVWSAAVTSRWTACHPAFPLLTPRRIMYWPLHVSVLLVISQVLNKCPIFFFYLNRFFLFNLTITGNFHSLLPPIAELSKYFRVNHTFFIASEGFLHEYIIFYILLSTYSIIT